MPISKPILIISDILTSLWFKCQIYKLSFSQIQACAWHNDTIRFIFMWHTRIDKRLEEHALCELKVEVQLPLC
jgi:hypothetical protein